MKSKTATIRTAIAIAATVFTMNAYGQSIAGGYPDQWGIIGGMGYGTLSQQQNNTTTMGEIVLEQHSMGQMMHLLAKWNREYNDYLKDTTLVQGIALGSTLYTEGVILVRNLYYLQKAVKHNPQGLVSTAAMNNLYGETATLLVKTFNLLKKVITQGNSEHMLTGPERLTMLWDVTDEIKELNKKIRRTFISIAYYDLTDVWKRATLGMTEPDNKRIANECIKEWKKAYKASAVFY